MTTLYKALQGAKKAAATKDLTAINRPVLQCVNIVSEENNIIVQATNGYYAARYTVQVSAPQPINVCILAKDLKNTPNTGTEISVQGDIVTINGASYPRYVYSNYIDVERYWPIEWASTTLYSIAELTSQIKAATGDYKLGSSVFNPAYLLLALKHLSGKVVRTSANGKNGPTMLDDQQGGQWLIMPIRS